MYLPKLPDFYIDEIIRRAINEDINYIDMTTDMLIGEDQSGTAVLVAKEDGVIAGIDVALRVFDMLDSGFNPRVCVCDGQAVVAGGVIARIAGKVAPMLKAERTALNLLQHMSGIATYTRLCAEKVAGTGATVTDTRKTLPGIRALQKYAVLCGGGGNHRYNLSSAALIKDNHIDAYGGIANAVKVLRERAGHMVAVEVEVRDLDELSEALEAGAGVIMLDNMSLEMMKRAVAVTDGRAALEASGNITLDNIREVAQAGVDIISIGALTHSVKAFDISMRWER